MRCFKKLLGISYRDHITNDAVRDRIRRAIVDYGIGVGAGAGQSVSHHMTLSVGQSAFESVDQSVNHHMLVNQ